jgi:probable HAF family extracellular repeat protein
MQDLGTLGGDWSGLWRFRRWLRGGRLGSTTPQGSGVPFAGRRRVGCRTSARWAAGESEALGVSADGSVVVGWAENAAGQWRAFRWTAAGGMEDLNITYAHLLTDGSVLERASAISPDGRYIVGQGLQRRHRAR